ncbi:hypothetical protein Ancab_025315 [Ancistrocladus abbreviatus]
MPRKPKRRCQYLPFAFSKFAWSIARVADAYKLKKQVRASKFSNTPSSKAIVGGNQGHSSRGIGQLSESSDEEVTADFIQADFAFFDPKPDDFHGVKILLQSYLDDLQWDINDFVELILAQTTVGTMVKIEDDEDDGIFAFVTALNLRRYKDCKCIMQLKNYLLKICQKNELLGKLKVLLEDQKDNVGLLVSQRVANLPLQLLPHLYDALFDEISWATEDEPTVELRKSYQFSYYLLVSRMYKKNTRSRKGSANSDEEDIIYIKPEDELFHKVCVWSFSFPLQTQQHAVHELRNYRLMGLVMAVEANQAPTFRQQLQSLIDES